MRFPLSRFKMLVLAPDMRRMQEVQDLMEKGKKEQAAKRQNANSQVHTIQVSGTDIAKINAHTLSIAGWSLEQHLGLLNDFMLSFNSEMSY